MQLDSAGRSIRNGDGRPPKLTPTVADVLASLVRRGVPLHDAARGCGIPSQSIANWVRKAKAADGSTPYQELYCDFLQLIEEAREQRAEEVEQMCATARVAINRHRRLLPGGGWSPRPPI